MGTFPKHIIFVIFKTWGINNSDIFGTYLEKTGNDEDPSNCFLEILEMRSISTRNHVRNNW